MAMGPRRTSRLEMRRERSGLRHYLDGHPLHAGTSVHLVMPDDGELAGHYEWTFRESDAPIMGIMLGPVSPPTHEDGDIYAPHAEVKLPSDARFYVECQHGHHYFTDRCDACKREAAARERRWLGK